MKMSVARQAGPLSNRRIHASGGRWTAAQSAWRWVGIGVMLAAAAVATALGEAAPAGATAGAAEAGSYALSSPLLASGRGRLDVWGKDNANDIGHEPGNTGDVWGSPDVRVLQTNIDGLPENALVGQQNFVFITVRNRGSVKASKVRVELYVIKLGTSGAWPGQWDYIGSKQVVNVPPTGSKVANPIKWKPTATGHYCVLVRMVTDGDPIGTETWDAPKNALDNNNIIWRNVYVVDNLISKPVRSTFRLNNGAPTAGRFDVRFREPRPQRQDSLLKHARIVVDLRSIARQLRDGTATVRGMTKERGSRYTITDLTTAAVKRVALKARANPAIGVSLAATAAEPGKEYRLDVIQDRIEGKRTRSAGGLTYQITM